MAYLIDLLENDLLTCLCAMLTAEGRPPCACHHYAGENRPPADRCSTTDTGENGMAWVRRGASGWRPGTVNSGRSWDGRFCGGSATWETMIEVGLRRCIKAVQVDNQAPDPDLYNQDRELLKADEQTLFKVLCCDVWTSQQGSGFTVVAATNSPLGPLGMCSGNVLQIVVSGDPTATDEPAGGIELMVAADAGDPTGYTAQAIYSNQVTYVSGPAGGG
jgi:hypothetical protein